MWKYFTVASFIIINGSFSHAISYSISQMQDQPKLFFNCFWRIPVSDTSYSVRNEESLVGWSWRLDFSSFAWRGSESLSSMILSKQIDGIVASMQEYMCILACQRWYRLLDILWVAGYSGRFHLLLKGINFDWKRMWRRVDHLSQGCSLDSALAVYRNLSN